MAANNQVSRRDFVKTILAGLSAVMGLVIGIPAVGYLISPATKVKKADAWIPVGPLEKYPTGEPTLFSFTQTKVNGWEKTVNSFGVFVIKTAENQATVYSNMCTHLSCRVNWKPEAGEYICPCHDGHFNSDGKVVAGPPPRPLDQYETKLEDGILYIHLKEG